MWQLISESRIKASIRVTAIPALLIGFVASFILPVAVIYLLNQEKCHFTGDAKFASDNDLKKSKLLKWEKENSKGILVGKYKGKYLWYTAPDFVSLGAEQGRVKEQLLAFLICLCGCIR